jgi:hypothetical protein
MWLSLRVVLSLVNGLKEKEKQNKESGMCIVYSNSCSYLLFISKSHSLLLDFALKQRSVIIRSNHRITKKNRRQKY